MMAASRVRRILLRRPGQEDGRDHNFPPWEAVYQQNAAVVGHQTGSGIPMLL